MPNAPGMPGRANCKGKVGTELFLRYPGNQTMLNVVEKAKIFQYCIGPGILNCSARLQYLAMLCWVTVIWSEMFEAIAMLRSELCISRGKE